MFQASDHLCGGQFDSGVLFPVINADSDDLLHEERLLNPLCDLAVEQDTFLRDFSLGGLADQMDLVLPWGFIPRKD